MAKIIAVSNHKGGVGKTTSVSSIGAGLALKNKKVLLVDIDPQANLSQSYRIEAPSGHIYQALKGEKELKPFQIQKNLFIIPANGELGAAEFELASEAGREFLLKESLHSMVDNFDFILLDCPPSLGLLTINAFTSAHEIYIPMQAQYLALQGIGKLLGLVDKIQKRLNPGLAITGIFITQYDQRKLLNRYVMETLESHFGEKVFKTRIRNNIALAEAPNAGCNIFEYQPDSIGAIDYKNLVKEILARNNPKK